MSRVRIGVTLVGLVMSSLVASSTPASAEPATTVSYPPSASATRYQGRAFDACTAPSLAAIRAWGASPYRALGVYFGGRNRSCTQPNLTRSWVSTVSALRWRLIPIYLGSQAPCSDRTSAVKFTAASASATGTAEAGDAVAKAAALGMLPGSTLYNDMEAYNPNDSTCRTAVLRYLSSWTKELHRRGYLSGVYANLGSGAPHLSAAYASTSYARPDALWLARYDLNPSLTGWTGIADTKWAEHQRGKQYRGGHNETYGGVTINIDNDSWDAPVATVALSYRVTTTSLNARSGPSTSYPVRKAYPQGSALPVVCQTPGSTVATTSVWNKLTDGTYVTDYYVSTPSNTTYSAPLPRCSYPYQVNTTSLNERSGPGTSYPVIRSLPSGALGWVYCQRAGTKVGTTSVWDRLLDGRYVTDYYLASPSQTTYSTPIPRC